MIRKNVFEHKLTFSGFIDNIATYGDNASITDLINGEEVHSYTFKKVKKDIEFLSAYLQSKCGTHNIIALLGEDSYLWIVSYFSIVCSGNICVPIDKELELDSIQTLLNRCESKIVLFSASQADKCKEIRNNNPGFSFLSFDEIHYYLNKTKQQLGIQEFEFSPNSLHEDDTAVIVFTSGTTGRSKGVMLSQKNILSNVYCTSDIIVNTDTPTMHILPLHHTYGLTTFCIALCMGVSIYINHGIKFIIRDFNYSKPYYISCVPMLVENIYNRIWMGIEQKNRKRLVTYLILLSKILLNAKIDIRRVIFRRIHKEFGGNLHQLMSGGAFLDEKYIQGLLDFGIVVLNGYGITECSPIVSFSTVKNRKRDSVGKTIDCSIVKIVNTNNASSIADNADHDEIEDKADIFDNTAHDAGDANNASDAYYASDAYNAHVVSDAHDAGDVDVVGDVDDADDAGGADKFEIGEICVSGDSVMKGYLDAEDNVGVYDGTWFNTGDLGRLDDEGYLFITGRKKNLIILSNGENISPEEIENIVKSNLVYVSEIVVYAENNSICAEIYIDKEQFPGITEEKVKIDVNNLNKTYASYKNIGVIKLRDEEFKKTTTRKIIRNERK